MVPLALADHVFSHRVYITGRVVDAEGRPVPGEPVLVELSFPTLGACLVSKPEVTSGTGDFEVCRHAHAVPKDARATVSVGSANVTRPLDPELRAAAFAIQTADARPRGSIQGDRAFAASYVVAGRVFVLLAQAENVELVTVNATPAWGDNVSATLMDGERVVARANGTVGEVGEFALELPVADVAPNWRVLVEAGRDAREENASALFRRTDVGVLRDAPEPYVPFPGKSTPLPGAWGAFVALAAAALVAGAARRTRGASRAHARREEE